MEHAFRGLYKFELMVKYLKTGETLQDEELLTLAIIADAPLLACDLEGRGATKGAQELSGILGILGTP